VERGLRDGELLGVVTTNALELGVDVGQLDVSILAGYPGSIAATWQQMGRAGRRGGTSVSVLIAGGGPVDRYVVEHPEFLLDSPPEEARLDPDNLHVLLGHLKAACFELPFEPGERSGRPKRRRCWRSWARRAWSAAPATTAGTGRATTSRRRRCRCGRRPRRTS
jgi:DEAD/DEAH box helicase domain-containing protein